MGGSESTTSKPRIEFEFADQMREETWFVNFRGSWYIQRAEVNPVTFEILGPIYAELCDSMGEADLTKIGSVMVHDKKYYLCGQMNHQTEKKDPLTERLANMNVKRSDAN